MFKVKGRITEKLDQLYPDGDYPHIERDTREPEGNKVPDGVEGTPVGREPGRKT